METTPSSVRLWSAAESDGHSDEYLPALPSDYFTPDVLATPQPLDTRGQTAPEPGLGHDAEALEGRARARTMPVARHTGPEPERSGPPEPMSTGESAHTAPVGSEAPPAPTMGAKATTVPVSSTLAANLDSMGDTHMGEAKETRVLRTTSCADSGVRHSECQCKHVSFLIGKYPNIGNDVIVERLDRLTDQWYKIDETAAGILDNQTTLEKDVAGRWVEQAQYHENVRTAFHKQQQVIDRFLQLVNDMSPERVGGQSRKVILHIRSRASSGFSDSRAGGAGDDPQGSHVGGEANGPPCGVSPKRASAVDPRVLPFVPMFSESTMLGGRKPPAGSMGEEHVVVDLRNLTRETAAAARDPPTSTAHAVSAEEEMHTMAARAKAGADRHGHGRGHPSRNLWVKDPATGIWTAGDSSSSKIITPWRSGGTGPLAMEERDVRGVYSHSPGTGGICLGGVKEQTPEIGI